jgi:hypothetical protein
VESSDGNLVPVENVLLSGTGTNRSLRITAGTNTGSVVITVIVADSLNAEARTSLTVTIESFAYLRFQVSSALRAGDLNRDGLLDILSAYGSSRYQTNLGQMRFRTTSLTAGNSSAALFSDWDRDGILDLAICYRFETGTAFTSGLYFGANNGLTAPTPLIALPFRGRAAFESGDFDGDGAPDFLAAGATNSGTLLRAGPVILYTSANSLGLQPKRIGLRTFDFTALASGDLDGDGRLDFICTGMTNTGAAPLMFLYNNDSGGNFTESRMSLPGLTAGGLSLADIDNDGDLDLAISGSATTSLTTDAIAAIYKNNGDGTFALYQTIITPLHHASVQWGDFDGDGDYDLLVNGYRNGGTPTIQVLVNDDGNFKALAGLSPVSAGVGASQNGGSAEWADLDGDGDLDILVGGVDGAAIYRNNLNPTNLKPSAPTGLRVRQYEDRIVLEWDAPTDAATMGMTYNVRLGSISGKDNYVPCMADPISGKRWVTRRGNAGQRKEMTISGMRPGRYFWSVQSIGPNYVGSEFSAESSVFITGPDDLRIDAINFSASGAPMFRVNAPASGELTIESTSDLSAWVVSRVMQVHAGANDFQVNLANGQSSLFVRASLKP